MDENQYKFNIFEYFRGLKLQLILFAPSMLRQVMNRYGSESFLLFKITDADSLHTFNQRGIVVSNCMKANNKNETVYGIERTPYLFGLLQTSHKFNLDDGLLLNYITDKLSDFFVCCDYIIVNNRMLFIYSERQNRKNYGNSSTIAIDCGYGDSFICLPLLKQYSKDHSPICFFHLRKPSYEMYTHYFPDCRHILVNWKLKTPILAKFFIYNLKKLYPGSDIIDLIFPNVTIEKNIHVFYKVAEILRISNIKKCRIPFRQSVPAIDRCCDQWIVGMENKRMIGFQFYSQTDSSITRKFNINTKNWPIESVKRFVSLCNKNQITVVILAPYPHEKIENVIDLSSLKLPDIHYIMGKLKLFVGIDSVCGHIAGLTGIPNITLWGGNYPHRIYTSHCPFDISYRVILQNYSIASKSFTIRNIKPELVLKRVIDILNGKIYIKQDIINYSDIQNNYNVEWVE